MSSRTPQVMSCKSSLRKCSTLFHAGMEALARPDTSPHGPVVAPGEAPEAITQAVASLPPEQMFELMKQMKVKPQYFKSVLERLYF